LCHLLSLLFSFQTTVNSLVENRKILRNV
jgi:hypothetical protein